MPEPATPVSHAPIGPPDPVPVPVLAGGGLRHAFKWFYHPTDILQRAQERFGNRFFTRLPSVGKVLVTGDAETIRATVSNPDLIGGRGTRFLRPLLGEDTLIVLEGEQHLARRKILAPHFKHDAVRHLDAMTLARCETVLGRLQGRKNFTAAQLAREVTLPVIIRLIFGELDTGTQRQAEEIVAALYHSFKNPLFLFLRPLQIKLGGLAPWGRLVKNRVRLNRFIDARIAQLAEDSETPAGLLAMLHASRDSDGESRRQHIYNEVIALLLFGHDTSAISLAWLFYHVYGNARVLAQLRSELESEDDLATFCESEESFLAACVRESLRLYPVVVHLTRIAVRDTEVAGIPISRGQAVLPSAWLAQRNEATYSAAHCFNPWRYSERQVEHESPYTFFPFGLGVRKCIGEALAMRQLKLMLAKAVRDADLELVYTDLPATRQMLLIGPRDGTPMRVRGDDA